MSINDFDGKTFVAYTDMSGTRKMMQQDEEQGMHNTGVSLLQMSSELIQIILYGFPADSINGILMSDSAIFFVRQQKTSLEKKFKLILETVQMFHKLLIKKDILLKTGIAYGSFRYIKDISQDSNVRLNLTGFEAPIFYKNGYSKAYEAYNNQPSLRHGECRILKSTLPSELTIRVPPNDFNHPFHYLFPKSGESDFVYFYWMLDDPDLVKEYEYKYSLIEKFYKSQDDQRFADIKSLLKSVRSFQPPGFRNGRF